MPLGCSSVQRGAQLPLREALLPTQPGRFQHSPSSYYGLTCSWIRQSPCSLEKPRQYSSLGPSSLRGLTMSLILLILLLLLSPGSEYPMLSFCLSCSVFVAQSCLQLLVLLPQPPQVLELQVRITTTGLESSFCLTFQRWESGFPQLSYQLTRSSLGLSS